MSIENKAGRERPANYETKEADGYRPGTSFDPSPTTEAEWRALEEKRAQRVRDKRIKGGAVKSVGDADTDALTTRIAEKLYVARRANQIAAVQRRANEIVSDRHTLDAVSKLERARAISATGAASIRKQVVMRRRPR